MAYDVFISFKNNDDNGKPTKESVTAKKLYDFLTAKGLRVFFSNVELEFLGTAQYMDAITEALDSSVFLIAVGSSFDNLNSKWVKSEWSSFLNDIYSNIKPNAAVFVLCDGMNMRELPRALRQQQAFDAKDSGSFDKLYNFIHNASGRIGSGGEVSQQQGKEDKPGGGTGGGTGSPASQKSRTIIITGVLTGAAALIILAVLLVPGWLRQKPITADPPIPLSESEDQGIVSTPHPTIIPATIFPSDPTSQTHGQTLTAEQQGLLDTFEQKFQEVLPGLIGQIMLSDKPFLAAAGQAFYTDPVFDEYGLTVTLMLPDPRAGSLDKLGLAQYTPHSGAQAYIHENYEKLRRMEGITDWLEYPVTFQLQKGIDGESTFDPSLFSLYFTIREYSDVFTLHVGQYMKDLGFYDAALELLMPLTGSWESSPDYNAGYVREYLTELADALEFKGIEVDGSIVADTAIIQKMLEERLAKVWTCDSVSIHTNTFHKPQLKMRALSGGVFFSNVREILDAGFSTGTATKPSSFKALEVVFSSAAREMADDILESTTARDRELFAEREYSFDWVSLGEEGLSSCPDLVDEIRAFLFSYDFYINFLAKWHGIGN